VLIRGSQNAMPEVVARNRYGRFPADAMRSALRTRPRPACLPAPHAGPEITGLMCEFVVGPRCWRANVPNELRAAVTGSHGTVGAGSIRLLDSRLLKHQPVLLNRERASSGTALPRAVIKRRWAIANQRFVDEV
jgi:hypothetical protein